MMLINESSQARVLPMTNVAVYNTILTPLPTFWNGSHSKYREIFRELAILPSRAGGNFLD